MVDAGRRFVGRKRKGREEAGEGAGSPPDPGGQAPATQPASPSPALRRGLALLVAGAFFMEILDGTVIAPAAPHIAADFGVPAVNINVAVSAYLLTLAVLIPISGWMADRFGPRTVFTAAIALFTLASVGCAVTSNLPMLTATRVVQGVGGAMMVPVGRLVVLRTTAKSDLIRAIAYLTWPALLAPVIAPAVGGILSTYASWRWIFLINVPLGLAGLLLARRLIPHIPTDESRPLDWPGFVLTAVGVAALVVAVENIGAGRTNWSIVAFGLLFAAVVVSSAVVYLLRTPHPLLDLRVLRIATFRVTAVSGSLYRMVINAVPFLLPLFFQLGFGWTAAQAGLVLIALFVGNVAIKPATTPLMRRFGIRPILLAALPASAVCLLAMAWLRASTPLLMTVAILILSGVFRSIGFSAYNSVAFADVAPSRMTHANTLMSTMQELGAGFGIAVGALLLRLGDPLSAALHLPPGSDTPFRVAFVLLAILMLAPTVEALMLHPSAGSQVTGKD
jgi:EmrB/QacA subfamily drug resistance transporter